MMTITKEQLNAAADALLDEMSGNGFDILPPYDEAGLTFIVITGTGDILASLTSALQTIGVTVD